METGALDRSIQKEKDALARALGYDGSIDVLMDRAATEITRLKGIIHIGQKKIAIATGYDSEDADKVENEIMIYAKDSEGLPFRTEFIEDIGKTSLDVPMLARLKVYAHEGADELIFRLDLACQNIGQKSMVTRQRESLIWAVCRLYDTELITGSRACELLDGIKAQEFRELYTKWAESI